jgi:hypothetical protein
MSGFLTVRVGATQATPVILDAAVEHYSDEVGFGHELVDRPKPVP